jgi:hypothetical protein
MSPDRTLSRLAKLLDQLATKLEKGAFPEKGQLSEFNALVAEYSKLLSTINEKPGKGQGEQDLEDVLIRGRKGAYESLLED